MLQEVAMARDCTAARTLTSQPGDEFPPEVSTRPSPQQAGHPSQQPARPRRRSGVSVIGEPQASDVVSRLHASLRERIGPQRYAVWFDGICRFAIESEAVTVISDGQFAQDLVRRSFRGDIEAVAAEVVGGVQAVLFRLAEPTDEQVAPLQHAEEPPTVAPPECDAERAVVPMPFVEPSPQPLPETSQPPRPFAESARRRPLARLEDFVTGGSNRMARAAAEMVVSRLGEISPLVIHGPSGTGKTHLLEGIVALVRKQHPGISAMLVPAEQFTTTFLQALHGSGLPGFRRSYRGLDILLVDDVQFFAGKRATAVELQQTFDALRRQGRQVICTCDREPETIEDLGADLLGRLEGGMSVRLSPAEFDVRRGIVAALVDRRGLECDEVVLDYVATHLTRNARELTGGVNRLEATSHMLGLPVSLELAEEALADLVRAGGRGVRLADIERAVCAAFGLEQGCLQTQHRARAVNHPRMLAMFLARKHTPAALAEIGSYFGRRSHSTVIAARKTVSGWLASRTRVQLADATWDAEEAVRRVEELLRAAG
ncbi:MAG: DnaA/Hda family protein [Planctomycetota bacterium]|nr:DnaA/Hda family protein [Planctomycetota bacterium]